jgi:hypothetical protein
LDQLVVQQGEVGKKVVDSMVKAAETAEAAEEEETIPREAESGAMDMDRGGENTDDVAVIAPVTADPAYQCAPVVGQRVEVYWEQDNTYYSGECEAYDELSHKHTIMYTDGSSEVLQLQPLQASGGAEEEARAGAAWRLAAAAPSKAPVDLKRKRSNRVGAAAAVAGKTAHGTAVGKEKKLRLAVTSIAAEDGLLAAAKASGRTALIRALSSQEGGRLHQLETVVASYRTDPTQFDSFCDDTTSAVVMVCANVLQIHSARISKCPSSSQSTKARWTEASNSDLLPEAWKAAGEVLALLVGDSDETSLTFERVRACATQVLDSYSELELSPVISQKTFCAAQFSRGETTFIQVGDEIVCPSCNAKQVYSPQNGLAWRAKQKTRTKIPCCQCKRKCTPSKWTPAQAQ